MGGLGPIELVVIVFIVVALFGPTLIAFWLGFTLGRKSSTPAEKPATPQPGAGAASAPTAATGKPADSATPEEPADD